MDRVVNQWGRHSCLPASADRNVCPTSAPRGSVLIFAVVVLAVLAMLSSAFLIVARHAIAASKSGINSAQTDMAMETGLAQGTGYLHMTAQGNFIVTPHGVVRLDPATNLLDLVQSNESSNSGAAYNSPFNKFVHDGEFDTINHVVTPAFAVLSSHYPDTRYVDANGLPTLPYYTTAPLRINPIPVSGVANDFGADRASSQFIRGNMVEFFNGVPSNLRKALPSVGTIRSRNYIWVRDLDANFYAVPAMWGLNSKDVPNYIVSEQLLAQRILEYLRTTPASDMARTMHSGDPAYIAGLSPTESFSNIGDFALRFPAYETDANYSFWRADIEQYFSTYLDAKKNADGSFMLDNAGGYIPQFKPTPAAVNINTAPEEVIQALISQIPYDDTHAFCQFFPPGVAPIDGRQPSICELLAKRIVAKRPFLCKVDFEDFVASLLPDDPTATANNAGNNTAFPVGAVKYAIQRRINRELRLSQFMEIPGLPEGDYTDGTINPYKNSNTALNMSQRFQFFLDEDDAANPSRPLRTECVLTVKAFNNFLNSVSTSPGPSLKAFQAMLPGTTGTPTDIVINGNGGSLDGIRLGGDDVISNGNILAGPNGIAETEITGYSYYSHDYGGIVPNEYKPVRLRDLPSPPVLDESSPKDCGKFVYGDPGTNYKPVNEATNGYKNYFLEDLQKWSCIGDGKLSGYYDMFFNPYDGMKLDFGEKSNPPFPQQPAATDIGIESIVQGNPLRTGLESDDIQQIDIGDPVDTDPDFGDWVIMLPGPNGKIETEPNKNNNKLAQSLGQAQANPAPSGDDRVVQAIRLSMWMDLPDDTTLNGDVLYFLSNDPYYYIIPAYGATTLASAPRPNDPTNPDPSDVDTLVQIIVDGGNGVSDTQVITDDVQDPPGFTGPTTTIQVGPNLYNETTVWGPIRASQRGQDQKLNINLDQVPTATLNSGNNGDVAWSPQICFRSRFYGMYVLAQGLNTQPKVYGTVTAAPVGGNTVTFTTTDGNTDLSQVLTPGTLLAIQSLQSGHTTPQTHVYPIDTFTAGSSSVTVTFSSPLLAPCFAGDNAAIYSTKVAGERRVEINYDAFNDEVLWRRSPLTEKRALGDPP